MTLLMLQEAATSSFLTDPITLPPLWVHMLNLVMPLVSAALVHASSRNDMLRFLISFGGVVFGAVLEQIIAEGSFVPEQAILTIVMGLATFLSSYKGLDVLAKGPGKTKPGLNARILPNSGISGGFNGEDFADAA